MSAPCAVVVADFAWFSQTCNQESVGTVHQDGEDWPVCAEHLATHNSPARPRP